MAPTCISPRTPNQPSSEHTTKPETAQSQPTDPTTVRHFQSTVEGSNGLTDPSMSKTLGEAASLEYVSTRVR